MTIQLNTMLPFKTWTELLFSPTFHTVFSCPAIICAPLTMGKLPYLTPYYRHRAHSMRMHQVRETWANAAMPLISAALCMLCWALHKAWLSVRVSGLVIVSKLLSLITVTPLLNRYEIFVCCAFQTYYLKSLFWEPVTLMFDKTNITTVKTR